MEKSHQQVHETQAAPEVLYQEGYVDEKLLPIQRIEGGESPKQVKMQNLPVPIRMIGYCFFGILVCMIIMSLVVSLIR
ncbi:hypothetical protein ACFOLF_16090 [Paenibacillus sepulcri]|uniref:Amino acid transporter n=1 Tax=Paenibacillus sepulcri TaxID=359917 RepID=A0ABS7CA59_9BACL|nr:hypothetical protein [Paenibacillus sepulcri]